MRKLYYNRGFTLVELMVVSVIMGIIATLVIVGNVANRKNVERTQVATSAEVYREAVNSVLQENKLVAPGFAEIFSCLSTTSDTSTCCFIAQVSGTNIFYGCQDNVMIGNFFGYALSYDASQVSSWIKKYTSNTPPEALPISSNAAACTSSNSSYYDNLPCTNQQIALHSYIMADGSVKSYLEYFLPPTVDCQSNSVATVTSFSGGVVNVSYNNAKYTDRLTTGSAPFTFCMVGVS